MHLQQKKFIYILESDVESRELCIEDDEVIENADGEIDIPLDSVLTKHHMKLEDLFEMKVAKVSLVEQACKDRKLVRSISFEHLRLNK
ncbi:hypothetical protein [Marinilactibacillus kalidii]|uniref:hypothetical protein n=1 Tax=Marinilactibacillus kalidii TaxID=2820274 RepID=UPI001ABE4FA0|nr:hypothetical protein [Marinilactibacillus kalidii]